MAKTEAKPVAESVNALFSNSPDGLREIVRAVNACLGTLRGTARPGASVSAGLPRRTGACSCGLGVAALLGYLSNDVHRSES